jgi:hypothetical protein
VLDGGGRISPRGRGPGPQALVHGSIDFIKHWPSADESTPEIKQAKG